MIEGNKEEKTQFMVGGNGVGMKEMVAGFRATRLLPHRKYSLISCRKFTPPQNRQLIVYYYKSKY